MNNLNFNWLGVLLAFVPYFILGALWFAVFFKKQYAISLGRENEQQQNVSPLFIVGPAVCTLIITVTSAILMNSLNIESYGDAVLFSIVIGIGYLVANTVNIAINPNIPRPFHYGAITGSYHLVGSILVSIILVAMK